MDGPVRSAAVLRTGRWEGVARPVPERPFDPRPHIEKANLNFVQRTGGGDDGGVLFYRPVVLYRRRGTPDNASAVFPFPDNSAFPIPIMDHSQTRYCLETEIYL